MKSKTTGILSLLLILCLILTACGKQEAETTTTNNSGSTDLRLERTDWADDVKKALNDFIDTYGAQGKKAVEKPYVVFDFDNTTSIFDVEEQLAIYQLQVMAFAFTPNESRNILLTDLKEPDKDLTEYGYGEGSLNDWADDISAAYSALWSAYGPFTAKGVSDDVLDKMYADKYWQEFATKMRALYSLVYDVQSSSIAYPWITYWFTGMTEEEVYSLAKACFVKYKEPDTSTVTWTSPKNLASKTGVVTYEWISGVQVSENLRELWRALKENGIDIWVCSASCTGAIRAAIDVFGLHNYCTGMIAMTNKMDENGIYCAEYDFESGCGFYAENDSQWKRMDRPTKAQTQGKGKVTAISNAISPDYGGRGPIAGFMDSTGDFNFCTEYETLKLVVCFNRANRKVTDGGGLIAEVAIMQRDALGYDLAKANEAGDTLYVLQGRDENGKRSLRNSNKTILLGDSEETLFKNSDNDAQLQRMIDDGMSTKDVLNTWSIKKSAGENGFNFNTGFLTEYDGYHSHK